MMRREPTNERDDLPLQIVGHRLEKVDAPTRGPERAPANANYAPSTEPPKEARGMTNGVAGRAQSARGRNTVLRQVVLVDREIDSLRDIAIALRDEYDFHITISGTEALNLLRHGAIDTIVVGQTLYSSTGLTVLAEARRHAPNTHRVLLANAVEASSVERGAAAVAPFRVMQRPCTADKLRELLEANDEPPQNAEVVQAQVRIQPIGESKPPTHTHDPADFEHVVLESEPDMSRRKHKSRDVDPQAAAALPIVVYTDNSEFYQAILQALQERHDLRLCTQLERAAEFAEEGQCPILITDRPATQVELQRISISLRALDAGMLILAAGPPETSSALRKLLGTEALHSFLPTPINGPLVRLVVESAKRQYLQNKLLRNAEPELKAAVVGKAFDTRPAMTPYFVPNHRADYVVDELDEPAWRRSLPTIAVVAVVLAAIAAGGWYGWQQYQAYQVTNAANATPDRDLELAQAAYDAGLYASPREESALRYYGDALKKAPDNAAAAEGLERTIDRMIEQAESALLKEQLDSAAEAIAAVRTAQPQNKRLPFLEGQLDKERGKASLNRNARSSQNNSAPVTGPEPLNDAPIAPISNETQRKQAVNRWLASARARIQQDKLTSPENDNAEFYLRQAERADPDNEAVRQSLRDIGARLLAGSREALSRQQLDQARTRLRDAGRFGADANTAERLRVDIETAAGTSARGGFLRLALQRTRDNRLFEPERDSAKYYLGQLERLDPDSAETQQAAQALALRLIENANQAIDQQQLNTAVQLLNETRRMGFAGPEYTAADTRLRNARNPSAAAQALSAAAPQSVASIAPPKPIKVVPPRFPEEAMRNGVQGWVDVSFRITSGGDVTDVVALASSPGRYAAQFERAAVAALSQYKYAPRTGETAPLSMVQKVQFRLGQR